MRKLIVWTGGQARKIARREAPRGEPNSSPNHRPLKRNIKTAPVRTKRKWGVTFGYLTANKGNDGARHSNPLLAGHKDRAGGEVAPHRPNYFHTAIQRVQPLMAAQATAQVKTWIAKDVKKWGEKQTKGVLGKASQKRLAAVGQIRGFMRPQ